MYYLSKYKLKSFGESVRQLMNMHIKMRLGGSGSMDHTILCEHTLSTVVFEAAPLVPWFLQLLGLTLSHDSSFRCSYPIEQCIIQ